MSWKDIIKEFETQEQYNQRNRESGSNFAEDMADRLPSLAKWPKRFDDLHREYQRVVFEWAEENDDQITRLLKDIKKLAMEDWEKTVAVAVQQIEKYGNDRDKAKLKENKYWMKGTVRGLDELYGRKGE